MTQLEIPGMEYVTRPGLGSLQTQVAYHQERLGRPALLVPGFVVKDGDPAELAVYDAADVAGAPLPQGYYGFDVRAADAPILYSLDLAPARDHNGRVAAFITRHANGEPDIDLMAQYPNRVAAEGASGRKLMRGATYIVDSEGWAPADDDRDGPALGPPMQYWHGQAGDMAVLGLATVTSTDLVNAMRKVADPWTEHTSSALMLADERQYPVITVHYHFKKV